MGSTAAIRTYQQPNAVVFLKTKEAFGGLSNMASGYPLLVNGIRILSSEALYQACRFPSLPDVQRLIIQQTSPMTAKMVSKPYRAQSRPDWERVRVKIMRWCLRVKLAQHRQAFGKLLLETGDLPIVEKSFKDEYWGAKPSYADTLVGMNVLGRLLMELREELKSGEFDAKAFLETPAIPDFLLDGKPIEPITMNQKAFTLSLQPTLFDPMPTTAPETILATTMQTFPKYATYKDSGIEWLGEIPQEWKLVRLKYVVNILKRIAGKEGYDVLSITQQGIKVKDVDSGEGQLAMDYSKYQLLYHGEFAMNHMDLLTGYVDRSAYDGVVSPDYRVFKVVSNDVLDSYLLLIFQLGYKQRVFYKYGQGVSLLGRWRLPADNFNNFFIPIPSLCQQENIIAFLSKQTAQIDAAIAIKEQQIALLKERKQILIQQAVTQGLDPTVPMKDSGVEWIGEIPAHWEVKKIKYLAQIFRGKFTHRPRNDPALYDGEYPFFQTGDVARAGKYLKDFKQTLNEKGLKVSTLIPKGTVVITIAANIGDVAILDIDACFPDSVVGFSPNSEIDRDFLYYSLGNMKQQFMDSSIKNTQMNLNVERIGANSTCRPPLAEQIEIVQFIEVQSNKIDDAVMLQQQQIEKLREYKTTLINSAVTGKIRVTPEMVAASA